jgi:hypothetical protein
LENCIIEFVRGVALLANRFVFCAPPERAPIPRLESGKKRRKADRLSLVDGGEDDALEAGEDGVAAALGGIAADAALASA